MFSQAAVCPQGRVYPIRGMYSNMRLDRGCISQQPPGQMKCRQGRGEVWIGACTPHLHPPQMTTEVVGMHPTGMHSCF